MQSAQERGHVLVAPGREHHRHRRRESEVVAPRLTQPTHAVQIVRTVPPQPRPRRTGLQTPRPARLAEPLAQCVELDPHALRGESCEDRERGARVVALVRAAQSRLQLEPSPRRALHRESRPPFALRDHLNVGHVARDDERGAHLGGALRDHGGRRVVLDRTHRGDARLEDAGLLARDRDVRGAEQFGVIEPDRGDRAHRGVQHVGGIESPAQTDLDHRPVHLLAGEVIERQRGRDLEERGAGGVRQRLDPIQTLVQSRLARAHAVHADALTERDEVRRRVEPGALPRGAQDALDERAHAALAVRTGHVDRGESRLGMSQAGEQRLCALESELGMTALESPQGLESALQRRGHGGGRVPGQAGRDAFGS